MTEDEKNSPVQLIPHSSGASQAGIQPIVLEYKKRKKKSKDTGNTPTAKYSKGLEDIQILGGNILRIAQKASKAVYKGIDTYQHEQTQSASKKKDGAIEDFVYNSAKGVSDFLKESSDIPVDLAESLNTKSYRKRLRRGLRRSSRIIRLWRI